MDQCWLRKSSPTEKALLRLGDGLRQHFMIGSGLAGINRRDRGIWRKFLVGIVG